MSDVFDGEVIPFGAPVCDVFQKLEEKPLVQGTACDVIFIKWKERKVKREFVMVFKALEWKP